MVLAADVEAEPDVLHDVGRVVGDAVAIDVEIAGEDEVRFDEPEPQAAFLHERAHSLHHVNQEVVIDGRLISARTWHDNPAWMREYTKMLAT